MEWIFFEELDFSDISIGVINIDTRDFYALAVPHIECQSFLWKEDKWGHLGPEFFFSYKEAKELVTFLFTDSGGKAGWRHLNLKGRGEPHCKGWLKYLRLHGTPKGWLAINSDNTRAISNSVFLESQIDKESLNAH